jgi:DNA-directed RNA polymerase subunit M/transcription elongation factor TFIIS
LIRISPKISCLICDIKIKKKESHVTIRYRYEDEKMGEAFVCKNCSKQYDIEDQNIGEPV